MADCFFGKLAEFTTGQFKNALFLMQVALKPRTEIGEKGLLKDLKTSTTCNNSTYKTQSRGPTKGIWCISGKTASFVQLLPVSYAKQGGCRSSRQAAACEAGKDLGNAQEVTELLEATRWIPKQKG